MRRVVPRLTGRRVVAGAVVLALVAGLVTWVVWPAAPTYTTRAQMVTLRSGPDGQTPVELDTTLYLPVAAGPDRKVPAILLAHGFGGTKDSVAQDAEDFAGLGYAVLAWTARGFGRSGDQIHLNSPDYEVRDAQRLLDWLAEQPEIRTDGPGDPRVGAVGGSYGGALALLLAGYDQRVDAIVPMVTWNDLARSFFPESTGAEPVAGVFKRTWAGLFFGGGGITPLDSGTGGTDAAAGVGPGLDPGLGAVARLDPVCGRFARDVCAVYQRVGTTGEADPAAVALLRRSSPTTVLDRVNAPTLLIQGQGDTLFPLGEADANARGIAATGTPVRVAWFTGGHDAGEGPRSDRDRLRFLTAQWLNHYVKGAGTAPSTSFTYSRVTGFDALGEPGARRATGYSVDRYPGLGGDGPVTGIGLTGPPQPAANPPDRNPAAVSSLPGAGVPANLASGFSGDLPGQHAMFVSAPFDEPFQLVGAPTVRLRAASPTGEAVLIVKLYDVGPDGTAVIPNGLVAPIRLTGLPRTIDEAGPVTVTLPGMVHRFEADHRLRVTAATSDSGYATPVEPTVYTVALGDAAISMPTVAAEPITSPEVIWRWVLGGVLALVAIGLVVALLVARYRHRRADRSVIEEYADTPLVVRGLRKTYDDGFVALSSVDFTVERGQVVGLLGPNGAGKTTTLRVLMGLTRLTAGEIHVFGHRLAPGAAVLSRLGALVEGPGFLPHLSGLENLRTFWRSTGRPAADARLDEALEIAGLGDAIRRKVKAYSHGMKQRLAIAQAMLGMPELLVLDEPTDGLDPPQIAEMRRVLQRYATDGRAVLVSSHLLAEVEQTCTHVVVVHRGEIVAAGPVEDIVGDSPTVQFDVSDVDAALEVLASMDGVRSVAGNGGLVVDINGAARSDVVAALVRAGVGVDRVVPRRRLEDAFLALVREN